MSSVGAKMSSSSGEKPPLFALSQPGANGSCADPGDLVPVAHEGAVHLDPIGPASFALTHIVTQERLRIDGDGWLL